MCSDVIKQCVVTSPKVEDILAEWLYTTACLLGHQWNISASNTVTIDRQIDTEIETEIDRRIYTEIETEIDRRIYTEIETETHISTVDR